MTGKSETVTAGQETIGKIISLPRGHEAYSVKQGYLATYPTLAEARRAIFDKAAQADIEGQADE